MAWAMARGASGSRRMARCHRRVSIAYRLLRRVIRRADDNRNRAIGRYFHPVTGQPGPLRCVDRPTHVYLTPAACWRRLALIPVACVVCHRHKGRHAANGQTVVPFVQQLRPNLDGMLLSTDPVCSSSRWNYPFQSRPAQSRCVVAASSPETNMPLSYIGRKPVSALPETNYDNRGIDAGRPSARETG